jgi:tRNA (guanosine-2'-O-)-methyltransferase
VKVLAVRSRAPRASEIERPSQALHGKLEVLVRERPEAVVEALAPLLSDGRRERIESVLDQRTREVTVVLDRLIDPHNVAAVVRTAEGLGLQEIHAIAVAPALALSRRVTQGCHKWLDLHVYEGVEPCVRELGARGYVLLAASERAGQGEPIRLPAGPVALCVGNEHAGLSAELRAACDCEIGVAMHGFTQSLNVSVATALLLSRLLGARGRGLADRDRQRVRARYYALSVVSALDVLEEAGLASGRRRPCPDGSTPPPEPLG